MYEIVLSGLVGALLGVILGSFLSYYFQILFYNHKQKSRKKFLATLFLNEIGEIKYFANKMNEKKIDSITIQIYNASSNTFHLDYRQVADLLIILNENPYFTGSNKERLKKSFEIFNNEIYSFEEPDLIRDLISTGKMVYNAELFLDKYFKNEGNLPGNYLNMVWFVSSVQILSQKIDKILSDKILEKIAIAGGK